MPFDPTNAPTFYTAMMKSHKDEWDQLFLERARSSTAIGQHHITTSSTSEIFVDGKTLVAGSRSIIDDILLWSYSISIIIIYFKRVF